MIPETRYKKNVVVLTIMWSTISFIFYTLVFMNKYFEGSLYLNFYLEGIAGISGSLLSLGLYRYVKMRWAFVISVTLTFIGVLGLFVSQQGYLSPVWIKPFLIDSIKECPYPDQDCYQCQ